MMENMWLSCILPAICGAEPGNSDNEEDPDNTDNSDNDDNAGGAGGDNGGGNDDKSGDNNEDKGDPQKKITAQQEILDRKEAKLLEKENELQDLRGYKQKAEDAKLSEEQKRDKELEDLQSKSDGLSKSMEKLVLKNAFLSSNEYEWHKPATALSLADLSEVEIVEKDGVFEIKDQKAFDKALKALAESDPYLLKQKSEDDDDKNWVGKSGDPAKKQSKSKTDTERASLKNKYPALRGR